MNWEELKERAKDLDPDTSVVIEGNYGESIVFKGDFFGKDGEIRDYSEGIKTVERNQTYDQMYERMEHLSQTLTEVKTEYDLVIEQNRLEFIEKVNEKLEQGWKLQGGVGFCPYYYMQAIYKEKENDYILNNNS